MSEQKTTEQIQYEKLTSLFKTYAGFLTTFLTILSGLTIFFTYSDRNAIREDYKQTIKELKEEITELKSESKESIEKISKNSEDELQRVSSTTNRIALDETQKQLSYIFGTDKIQNLIQNQAIKEVKSKVIDIVNDETKNFYFVSDAASQMRNGNYNALKKLKYYSENSENLIDRERAKNLLNQISKDFFETYKDADFEFTKKSWTEIGKAFGIYNNKEISEFEIINSLITYINNPDNRLEDVCYNILCLSKITKQDFKPFEFEKINRWFFEWKKNIKSVK